MTSRRGLVTGATGYIGGAVVPALLDEGWEVRVLVRDKDKLTEPWADDVDIVEGDASDAESLNEAMVDVDVAWFLIHSMGDDDNFAEAEQEMAARFAQAAERAQVSRIVYLGGLHPEGEELSEHLASRVEVGEIFLGSGVPTAAIQAGVVLGDGSASFQMLRTLTERLPGAIGPDWLKNQIQPIFIDDMVHYLVRAADLEPHINRTFDVGGPESLSYGEMMQRYAQAMGLGPRPIATAPVTTAKLASHWVALVTPIPRAMALPLIESVLHNNVVTERDLDDLVGPPPGGLTGFDDAVRQAAAGHDKWQWAKLVGVIAAAVVATAVSGALATDASSRWYTRLRQPSWQPPGWLFAPVWTALNAAIIETIALHLADALEKGDRAEARSFAGALGVNLLLNASWPWVFFKGRNLGASTAAGVALAASSADLVRRVAQRPERGVLLSPYAAWTAFAAVLTWTIYRKNR